TMQYRHAGAAGWRRRVRWAAASLLTAQLLAVPAWPQDAPPAASPANILTLSDALTLAAGSDPALAGMEARADAWSAAARQAGRKPNPVIGLEAENFAGTGPVGLLDQSETTLSYEQRIERGGDREAR